MLRARFGRTPPYKNKNVAHDPQLRTVGPLCGTPGYPQALCRRNGGGAHAPAVPGLSVAHPVHVDQWSGLRRFALEPAALLRGQCLAGVVAVAGGVARDSSGGVRFGDTQSPGPADLVPHVPARLDHDRPDPGWRWHCPGAGRQLHAAGLGVRPDRCRDIVGQCRLCGEPAGVSVIYLAVPAAGDRLSVLGRRRAGARLGLAGPDSARLAERGGVAGQSPD